MTSFIDTHAHFDDCAFDSDRENALARAAEAGALYIVDPGQDAETSAKCAGIAETHDFVYAAAGIHPELAEKFSKDEIDRIAELLKHPKVVAVGETGLDYHYDDGAPRDVQIKNFAANIALSKQFGKPVIVHDRDAHKDTLDVLLAEGAEIGKVVFHCYSGSAEMAKVIASHGWYFSIGGAVTFKNARKIVESLAVIPEELLMLETDSPYMAPVPHRGERNESSLVPFIAERIAEIKLKPVEEVFETTTANAIRFFGLPAQKPET